MDQVAQAALLMLEVAVFVGRRAALAGHVVGSKRTAARLAATRRRGIVLQRVRQAVQSGHQREDQQQQDCQRGAQLSRSGHRPRCYAVTSPSRNTPECACQHLGLAPRSRPPVQFLLLSFLALALGPFLVMLARKHAWSSIAVDSFCVLTITGFALLHILPECVEQAGWYALPLALVGFLAPVLAERGLHPGNPRQLRMLVLVLALLGMAAHDILDGMGLALGGEGGHEGHDHGGEVLAWAVILHRVPAGIGIWWIVPRTLGRTAAIWILAISVPATSFGYFVGTGAVHGFSTAGLAMLQALLAGSLLHVVLHAHIPAPKDKSQRWHFASVGGAVAAFAVLWIVIHNHFPRGDDRTDPVHVFVKLAIESAPALLVAYFLVGLCQVWMPPGWLKRITSGPPLLQALRGVAVGLPLPVCSCGVVPIYRQLVQKGASLGAAIAFLVATPELEVAAVLLTWSLMGGEVALVRVGMAALLALGTGLLVGRLQPSRHNEDDDSTMPAPVQGGIGSRLWQALRFGYGPAVDNTATWIVIGLLLSAMLMPYVSPEWIAALPKGIDVPIAALLGLPLYVCATGSTPLAAMFLAQGLSPGAVLAFLLTGPATNVTTFAMVARLHGARIAVAFAVVMWCGAVLLGYVANWLLPSVAVPTLAAGELQVGNLDWALLIALGALFAVSLLRQGVRPFIERLFESPVNACVDDGEAGCCGHEHAHGDGHAHGCGHDHDRE